jgi:hypothetical protein
MQYVNQRGEPFKFPEVKPVKKAGAAKPDSFHKGWKVVGFSPAQLAEARAAHEKNPPEDGKAFDKVAFMRTEKPLKARSKPYTLHDAAVTCKEMLEKAGWELVQVIPVAKGQAS